MPELIGGIQGLQKRVKYPEIAKKAGVEGTVFLQFVVDEKGNVVDPAVVKGIGAGCDEAALEAIKTAKFKPGKQRGKPVKVKFSLPVRFRLK
jgi:protein TonB